MKLKVGGYYKNRGGDVIHIINHDKYKDPDSHPYSDEEGNTYLSDGTYNNPYDRHDLDIVGVQF